jgi:hypothetical protein
MVRMPVPLRPGKSTRPLKLPSVLKPIFTAPLAPGSRSSCELPLAVDHRIDVDVARWR